jgi:hypothetical protein
MNRRTRTAIGAMSAALIIAAVLCFSAVSASAQPFVWNPPCTNNFIRNATGCTVTISFKQLPNFSIPAITLLPFQSLPLNDPPGTTIMGVISQMNVGVPFIQPGPPLPGTIGPPTFARARGIIVDPMGCCVDVYVVTSGAPDCVMYVYPGTLPCTP